MSLYSLKMIALFSMLIDHIGAVVIAGNPILLDKYSGLYVLLRLIGRLAFPIFCFALVEGYKHTKSIKKYIIRIGIFALISEIPFDLAINGVLFDFSSQNIMFSFFICIIMLYFLDIHKGNRSAQAVTILISCLSLYTIDSDYSYIAGLLVAILYLADNKIIKNILATGALITQLTAPLALIPISLYNGEKGKYSMKYIFYTFYPLHLLILYFIKNFMVNS